jgi:LPXTG-motif cell wall-anchored protein
MNLHHHNLMIKKTLYNTIFIFVSVFFSLFVTAQSKTTVSATVDRSRILIGEPIQLRLEADIPDNQPIRFFQVDSFPHFEFLSVEKIDTSNTSTGTVLSQLIYLTSFDSGHWVIPSFVMAGEITTDTLPVDVDFSPSPFDTQQAYHDIKEIIEVTPEEEKKEQRWWYIVVGAVVLIILLVLLLRKKKKPEVVVVKPPDDPYKTALESLERLQKEKTEAKQYYSMLIDIFRVYVSSRKGIHSLQETTDDLVVQLRGLNMPKEQFEQLSQSLRLGDFVKFAKYIPTEQDAKSSFDAIKRSIDYIEQMK